MTICRGCKETLDEDSPYSVRIVNPLTFREGWFHDYCLQLNMEQAMQLPPVGEQYESRYEEWLYRI